MNEEELQKEYYEYQYLQKQLQATRDQINQLRAAIDEANAAKQALENMSGENVFSIGGGILVKAKKTSETVLVETGARIIVEKTVPEAVTFLNKKMETLEKAINTFNSNASNISKQLMQKEKLLRLNLD